MTLFRWFVLFLISTLPAQTPYRGCGTLQAAQRQLATARPKGMAPRLQAPADLRGRTLLTAHFALHYSLGPSVHRVKWTPGDSALRLRTDSILQTLSPSLTAAVRDSTLHASLDFLGAPHPGYVIRAAQYCESARAHFVDTLGMMPPGVSAGSGVFTAPQSPGRFRVDIADIGTADPIYRGEYYALTYPPPQVSILLENDFLWNARWDASGNVLGSPVHAEVNGQVLHFYDQEWDLGLKVTLMHEIYHGVQFAYTPSLSSYHAWYEISATGMEERLAPEVDDYFQYLPCVLRNHATMGLLAESGPCSHYPMYGQAAFHLYLSRALGPRFDVTVWSALRSNPGDLRQALLAAAGSTARWDSLYTAYAAALAGAGRPEAAAGAFTSDLPRWPVPTADSMPPPGPVTLAMPSLSFRLLAMQGAGNTGRIWGDVADSGWNGLMRVDLIGSDLRAVGLPGNRFPLAAGTGNNVLFFSLANPSLDRATRVDLAPDSGGSAAFPNPATLADPRPVLFAAPAGSPVASPLTIVSSSGRRVADLVLAAGADFWSWDLRSGGTSVPPGVYFYRADRAGPRPLLVLPR